MIISLLLVLLGCILGFFLLPIIIYLRGRKNGWDDSNIFNVFHILCHLALHPNDFNEMYYKDGSKPFWYLTKDEFSEVIKCRPNIAG